MGLCLSNTVAEEPVRRPVQTYTIQQQPSAPPMNYPQPNYPPPNLNYVQYSQNTYAIPYVQTPAPSAKQSFSNEDPQPVQYPQQWSQPAYPPQQYPSVATYYVQQPVYRQPVQQQNNTGLAIAGGFLAGSMLADIMDD